LLDLNAAFLTALSTFKALKLNCSPKSTEQIELLQLDKSGIKVAEYLTQLPDRELLKQKLHQAVIMAREQMRKKMRSDRAENGKQIVQSLTAQLQKNSNGQGQGDRHFSPTLTFRRK